MGCFILYDEVTKEIVSRQSGTFGLADINFPREGISVVEVGSFNFDATHIDSDFNQYAQPATAEEIKQTLVDAVQEHLDNIARIRNYDGVLSLCSYATSTDAAFAAEGQAGVEWRDACWRYCYQVLIDVQAELRTIPTPTELLSELPVMVW